MSSFNYDKLNIKKKVQKQGTQSKYEDRSAYPRTDTPRLEPEKPRKRQKRPTGRSRRYGWKEAIFGRDLPDLCALREGPYRPTPRQDRPKRA